MSTFARRLAIPAGQTSDWFSNVATRRLALVLEYGAEYRRALDATADYEALKRLAQSAGCANTLARPDAAREVWRRHYA
jgi:hypothetical protein